MECREVVPAVGRRLEFDDAPLALHEMAAGKTSGKSVIVVAFPTAE